MCESLETINTNINSTGILYTNMNWEPILSHLDHALTYVGVIWFILHVFQLLLFRFTQQNQIRVALANLRQNIHKNRIENQTSLDSFMVIRSSCLLMF